MAAYVPPSKEVLARGYGPLPPPNGVIRLHILTLLGNGSLVSDTRNKYPKGKRLDLTEDPGHQDGEWISTSSALQSLLDEIPQMKPGEIARFTYAHDEIVDHVNIYLPEKEDLIVEVHVIEWSGQDISEREDKSLIKMILAEGTSTHHPFWTGKCKVSLNKATDDDERVVTLRMGDSETYGIDADVERCILTMTKNEVTRLVTPDNEYVVTLLGLEKQKNPSKMERSALKEAVQRSKDCGNDAFRAQKYRLAGHYYEQCIFYCDSVIDMDDNLSILKQQAHLNLAQVQIIAEDYAGARDNCNTVLWQDCNCVKALYRRAVSNKNLNNLHVAESDLNHLLSLEPENVAARKLKRDVAKEWQDVVAEERVYYQRAFEKIEQKNLETENVEPLKSLWEIADETCPPELQSPEAYDEYKKRLNEEAKLQAEEEQRRLDEYNAANPPKKKKKRKKKKKKQEITVTETEQIEVKDEEAANEDKKDDVDTFKYSISSEKTFIGNYDETNLQKTTAAEPNTTEISSDSTKTDPTKTTAAEPNTTEISSDSRTIGNQENENAIININGSGNTNDDDSTLVKENISPTVMNCKNTSSNENEKINGDKVSVNGAIRSMESKLKIEQDVVTDNKPDGNAG